MFTFIDFENNQVTVDGQTTQVDISAFANGYAVIHHCESSTHARTVSGEIVTDGVDISSLGAIEEARQAAITAKAKQDRLAAEALQSVLAN
jgi:thiamine biosynthesis lipoprotein ApbE